MQAANQGSYSVAVANLDGDTMSASARLTLGNAPQVIVPPQSVIAPLGGQATFRVTASGTNLYYQWQFGGTQYSRRNRAVAWATNLGLQQAGQYSVVITNFFGMTNAAATLTVTYRDGVGGDTTDAGVCFAGD